jgi:eukaryotic-like serine/threonine-protein kinase
MAVAEKKPTTNFEAYDLYLKGLYSSRLETREALEEAIHYFELATQKDPGFSLAYSAWADAYIRGAGVHFPQREAYPRAKELLGRALELGPGSPEAHRVRATLALQGELDWEEAESEFQKAIALNPSDAEAHLGYSQLLAAVQRFDEARDELRQTLRVSPSVDHLWTRLIEVEFLSGEVPSATTLAEEVRDRDPNAFHPHLLTSCCYLAGGRTAEALKEADQIAGPAKPSGRVSRAILLARLGKPDEAGRLVKDLEGKLKSRYVPLSWVADLYAALGEKEKALDALERDFLEGDRRLWSEYQLPHYAPLREDPRFVELLRSYKLPTEPREQPSAVGRTEAEQALEQTATS